MQIREHWLFSDLISQKGSIIKSIWLNVVSNFLQILVSLFVMAVYNKVLPNYAVSSLTTMAVGIVLIIAFDFLFKLIKARIISNSNDLIDEKLQKNCFRRF